MTNKKNSKTQSNLILVVEDSPTQAEQLKYFLEKNNNKVLVAKNGKAALDLIQKQVPAVVISDIIMPEMNGYELCRKIKSDASTQVIPVILLTSLTNMEDMIDALASGADSFLSKPYDEDYLLSQIEQLLLLTSFEKNAPIKINLCIPIAGKKHTISSNQHQILTLLFSSFEAAINKNKELLKTQDELKLLNESLEEKVTARTEELTDEIFHRKKSEKALTISEVSYRRLFEAAKDGIIILDAETGMIKDVNPFLIEKLGYSKEQFLEKEIWEIGFFKDIIANHDKFLELQQKEYVRYEDLPLETVDGKKLNVEFISNIYTVYHQNVIQCNIRDNTERKRAEEALKESEERFRMLFEGASDGIALADAETGTLIECNQTIYSMVERSKTELIGKSQTILHPPQDTQEKFSATFRQHKEHESSQALEDFLISKSGRLIPVEITAGRIQMKGRDHILGIFRDITKRKKAEELLQQAHDNLENQVHERTAELAEVNSKLQIESNERQKVIEKEKELNALKSQFISTVSHEFRTPLAGILSSAQLLKLYNDKWDEQKKEKVFKQIFDSVKHTITLLDDVSLINKGESNSITMKPSIINLQELLLNIINENKQVYGPEFEIVTTIQLIKSEYFFDKEILRHIFGNVLSNAIKYSGESKKILFNVAEEKDKILFNVIDYGIGIPATDQKFLFETFRRASNVGAIRGTGFGLSIVKRMVDLLNGEIEVISEEGKGTSVTIKLPITKVMEEEIK